MADGIDPAGAWLAAGAMSLLPAACDVCRHPQHLNLDGTIRPHLPPGGGEREGAWLECEGSGKLPGVVVPVVLPRWLAERLTVLASPDVTGTAAAAGNVIGRLLDHAGQGVRRPGSRERAWVEQVFGSGWLEQAEPGEPSQ